MWINIWIHIPVCRYEILLDFADGSLKNGVKDGVWVGSRNVVTTPGYGSFKGNSFLTVPFYRNNDKLQRRFGFQMRVFFPDDRSARNRRMPRRQIGFANCKMGHPEKATLKVEFDTEKQMVDFTAIDTSGQTIQMVLPYSVRTIDITTTLFIL